MNNPFIKISLSITLLLFTLTSFAQHYSFTNYSLEEGLPQSEVSSLIQDTKGNLWLGTNGGGLSRFNGKKFISYSNNNDGLADNNIRSLFQDKKENIWIGTSIGISYFNGINFTNYGKNDSLPIAQYRLTISLF